MPSTTNPRSGGRHAARRVLTPIGVVALIVLAGQAVVSSHSVPTDADRRRQATKWQADRLARQIENSRVVRNFKDKTTDNIVQVAASNGADVMSARSIEPDDAESIYQWTELVLRFVGTDQYFISETTVEGCWKYVYEGNLLRSQEFVSCPPTEPLAVVATVAPALPSNAFDRLQVVLEDLDPDLMDDAEAVRQQTLAAFPDLGRATIEVAIVRGTVGVTMFDGRDTCVMGRRSDHVEVWYPQSADATAEGAGCPANSAALGEFQIPPH